jgi:activating signal cointegrator 1
MRALSLWQPWASLWVGGGKLYETRTWTTPYRGWLLVHASKREPTAEELGKFREVLQDAFGANWDKLPRGAIVGAVKVEKCHPCDQVLRDFVGREFPVSLLAGDFSDGRYAWRRGQAVRLPEPLPFNGRQRFFEVPASALPSEFVAMLT